MKLYKPNSGVGNKSSKILQKAEKMMMADAKKGVMSGRIIQFLVENRNDKGITVTTIFEMIDKHYPNLEGFSWRERKSGKSSAAGLLDAPQYLLMMKLPDGSTYTPKDNFNVLDYWYRYPFTGKNDTPSARSGERKYQQYIWTGRHIGIDGKIMRPSGYWSTKEHVDEAIKKGWEVPKGVMKYHYPKGVK